MANCDSTLSPPKETIPDVERLRLISQRQDEERKKKLDDIKAKAMAVQQKRIVQEEERAKRIFEQKIKDIERRHQVEDRKKAILNAERQRREFILKQNEERDIRLEAKRRADKRSSYAFGSSTPRLFDNRDLVYFSSNAFWTPRRSMSTNNISCTTTAVEISDDMMQRDLSKPSSASRNILLEADHLMTASMGGSVARRRTDLIPTIPCPREGRSTFGSRNSLISSVSSPSSRAFSMTRLDQLSTPLRRYGEHISAILHRERKNESLKNSTESLLCQTPPSGVRSARTLKSPKPNLKDSENTANMRSPKNLSLPPSPGVPSVIQRRAVPVRRRRPVSIDVSGFYHNSKDNQNQMSVSSSSPLQQPSSRSNSASFTKTSSMSNVVTQAAKEENGEPKAIRPTKKSSITKKDENKQLQQQQQISNNNITTTNTTTTNTAATINAMSQSSIELTNGGNNNNRPLLNNNNKLEQQQQQQQQQIELADNNDLTQDGSDSSLKAAPKNRIVTEEEAKAAIAEKRRLIQLKREQELMQQEEQQRQAQLDRERLRVEKIERDRQQQQQLLEQQELARQQAAAAAAVEAALEQATAKVVGAEAEQVEINQNNVNMKTVGGNDEILVSFDDTPATMVNDGIASQQLPAMMDLLDLGGTQAQNDSFNQMGQQPIIAEMIPKRNGNDAISTKIDTPMATGDSNDDRKALAEAKIQSKELAERLKREEIERQERRKRVAAIMSRARTTNASANNKQELDNDKLDSSRISDMENDNQLINSFTNKSEMAVNEQIIIQEKNDLTQNILNDNLASKAFIDHEIQEQQQQTTNTTATAPTIPLNFPTVSVENGNAAS